MLEGNDGHSLIPQPVYDDDVMLAMSTNERFVVLKANWAPTFQ